MVKTTNQDTTKDGAAKRAAVAILTKGLATRAEVARLAGVTRQAVGLWAAAIPVERNRERALSKIWNKEIAKK